MSFTQILHHGGPILWFIIISGIIALGVFIERGLHLHRARIKSDDFLTGIFNILSRHNIQEAMVICDETPGPVAYIVKTAIQHRDDPRAAIQHAVEEASLAEISRMERRLVVVATVAQITPLLGLLGTVIGMLKSLLIMRQQFPMIQSADVTEGLLLALITTAAGLMVAIPCYAAFNLLVIKVDRIVLDMQRAAADTLAFLDSCRRSRES